MGDGVLSSSLAPEYEQIIIIIIIIIIIVTTTTTTIILLATLPKLLCYSTEATKYGSYKRLTKNKGYVFWEYSKYRHMVQ
jgi:hypothetical protein